jgi:hypothetical protein
MVLFSLAADSSFLSALNYADLGGTSTLSPKQLMTHKLQCQLPANGIPSVVKCARPLSTTSAAAATAAVQ